MSLPKILVYTYLVKQKLILSRSNDFVVFLGDSNVKQTQHIKSFLFPLRNIWYSLLTLKAKRV